MRTLIHAGSIYAPNFPQADSVLIDGGVINWVGQYAAIANLGLEFNQVIDMPDVLVAPGFVDSHVHLSATGALMTNLDLREAQSATQAIELVKKYVLGNDSALIIGHGWDDTNWTDRQDWNLENLLPTIGQRDLYLSRIDVHSALTQTKIASGFVYREEHGLVREHVQNLLSSKQRKESIRAALNHAASQGIVAVHENGGPTVSSSADFKDALSFNLENGYPKVFGYWGSTDLDEVKSLGAFGAAGDLNVDGSIGSRTALLTAEYTDEPTLGTQYLSVEQIAAHLIATTKSDIQGGFHAIGDGALEGIVAGLKLAEDEIGLPAIRRARHRIEHAEMLSADHFDYLAKCGVVLSMQPIFDELWGDQAGLYEKRLGKSRTSAMNSFAGLLKSGVTLAFSSDSPVTPIDPWRTIQAAQNHHTNEHRISARAAFTAHTRGGWRAVRDDVAGVIDEGAPAHLALWQADSYHVNIPDDRIRAWSTDERSGTPALPDLSTGTPQCLATLVDGEAIYDPTEIFS